MRPCCANRCCSSRAHIVKVIYGTRGLQQFCHHMPWSAGPYPTIRRIIKSRKSRLFWSQGVQLSVRYCHKKGEQSLWILTKSLQISIRPPTKGAKKYLTTWQWQASRFVKERCCKKEHRCFMWDMCAIILMKKREWNWLIQYQSRKMCQITAEEPCM